MNVRVNPSEVESGCDRLSHVNQLLSPPPHARERWTVIDERVLNKTDIPLFYLASAFSSIPFYQSLHIPPSTYPTFTKLHRPKIYFPTLKSTTMQFSTIIVALFAGVTIAAPSAPVEARQNTAVREPISLLNFTPVTDSIQCNLCRQDCFFSPGSNAAYEGCIASCNSALGCTLTP